MIYLASPYSHAKRKVRERRFEMACRATARLIHAGQPAFSPIVHSHPLVRFGLPTDWEFWQRCDRAAEYGRPDPDRPPTGCPGSQSS